MAKFSERNKFVEARLELQLEYIDETLKISLWNVLLENFFESISKSVGDQYYKHESEFSKVSKHIWRSFYKKAVDDLALNSYGSFTEVNSKKFIQWVRDWFFIHAEWYEIYDLIEFVCSTLNIDKSLIIEFNSVLERELSGYRLVSNIVTPITSKQEVKEVNDGLNNARSIETVYEHLMTGLKHLSDRKAPDYRNSIKESISAVESLSCSIVGNDKATLGEALKIIEKSYSLHGALKGAFSALYGYTSDSGGIRHNLMSGDEKVGFDEAKFMFISCVAFTNYLIAKIHH